MLKPQGRYSVRPRMIDRHYRDLSEFNDDLESDQMNLSQRVSHLSRPRAEQVPAGIDPDSESTLFGMDLSCCQGNSREHQLTDRATSNALIQIVEPKRSDIADAALEVRKSLQ